MFNVIIPTGRLIAALYIYIYILHVIYTTCMNHTLILTVSIQNWKLVWQAAAFSSNQTALEPVTYLYPEQSANTDGRQGRRRNINTCDQVLVSHCKTLGKWFTPSCFAQCHKPENNNWKNSVGSHSFHDTRLRSDRLPSAEIKVAVINLLAPFSSTSN